MKAKAIGSVVGLALLLTAVLAGSGLFTGSGQLGWEQVSVAPRTPAVASPTSTGSASAPDSRAGRDSESGLAYVDFGALPEQARRTIGLIDRGGPYPYRRDDGVFGNRERILPARPSGFYREYTVPTPGEADRGQRRIVAGDGGRQLFYTDDHYASFRRVRR